MLYAVHSSVHLPKDDAATDPVKREYNVLCIFVEFFSNTLLK